MCAYTTAGCLGLHVRRRKTSILWQRRIKKIATFYDRFTQPKDAKTRPMQHVVVVRLETAAFEL